MKKRLSLALALTVGLGMMSHAALMRVDADTGMDLAQSTSSGTFDTEAVPPSGSANMYARVGGTWLNHGNTNPLLAYDVTITDGLVVELVFQNWGALADGPGDSDLRGLTVIGTDGTTEVFKAGVLGASNGLTGTAIVEGTAATFQDTDGQWWQIDYDFTSGGAGGDIVGNTGIIGVDDPSTYYNPGPASDHLATVTYTAIPEPATLGMVAVFGGGILFIRRKLMM